MKAALHISLRRVAQLTIAVTAITALSCRRADSNCADTADTLPTPSEIPIYTDAQTDSLSMLLGRLCAADVAARRAEMEQQNPDSAPSVDNFITGMEAVFADTASSPGFTHGIVASRTTILILDDFYRQGIVLDKPSLIRGLTEQLMPDSLTTEQVAAVNARYSRLWNITGSK